MDPSLLLLLLLGLYAVSSADAPKAGPSNESDATFAGGELPEEDARFAHFKSLGPAPVSNHQKPPVLAGMGGDDSAYRFSLSVAWTATIGYVGWIWRLFKRKKDKRKTA